MAKTKDDKKGPGPDIGGAEGKSPTEPVDTAPGKPKVDEDAPTGQKLAGGAGSAVFMNTPLIKGVPVVVPVVDGMVPPDNLVEGVAVAAAVVTGAPEMIANAQAEFAVENPNWAEGDIKSVHYGQGEVLIDKIDKDGSVRTERHRVDEKTYKAFEKSFEEGDKAAPKAFAKKHFTKETAIPDPNAPFEED